MADLVLFLPETTVLVAALVTLVLCAADVSHRALWLVSLVLGAAVLAATVAGLHDSGEPFAPGIYRVDAFSRILQLGIATGLLLTLLSSADLGSMRERVRTDMPVFLFLSTAGMMMLVAATELLTFYVALELSAYGLYILCALHRSQREGSEAATKYVLFGAAGSAVSLYGISLVFGATRTTYMAEILEQAASMAPGQAPLLVVGAVLVLASLLFKLAVFPFHAWAPDAYQGAPHQSATFIGTVSKVAAVGVLVRVLSLIDPDASQNHITEILIVLCVLSMTVGNLAAMVQKDLKRLLAYSTVAHAGYMLIGLLAFSATGNAAAIFYAVSYVPMVFCPFLVVCVLGKDGSNPTLASLAGLHRRSPFLAALMLIGMFGLAGIPPTPGFAGKWFLFAAALERSSWMFALVLVAAVNATLSLYYYLQVVKAVYLSPGPAPRQSPAAASHAASHDGAHDAGHDDDEAHAAAVDTAPAGDPMAGVSPAYRVAGILAIVVIAVLGFYPRPIWDLAMEAAYAIAGG